jgi:hypothetical protein
VEGGELMPYLVMTTDRLRVWASDGLHAQLVAIADWQTDSREAGNLRARSRYRTRGKAYLALVEAREVLASRAASRDNGGSQDWPELMIVDETEQTVDGTDPRD